VTTIVVIAVAIVYLAGIGATFQLAESLKGRDMYGHASNAFRWFASCFWPITASVATGISIARQIQDRQKRPPRAIASDRKAG
jgi:hypothetical protein